MTQYRLRHLVRATTRKTDVDPDLGRVDLEDLEAGTSRLVTPEEVRRSRTGEGTAFQPGDVLFSKLRPYLRKGMYAEQLGCSSPELVVMRPQEDLVDGRFLHYLTMSDPFVGWAVATSQGVKMPRTSAEALGEYRFGLPSLERQRDAAASLTAETRRLDALGDAARAQAALIRERLAARVDRLILDEGRQDPLTPLMYLVNSARPIQYGILMPGPNVPVGVPVVDAGDVEAGRAEASRVRRTTPDIEQPYARSRLLPGDIVMSIRGSWGAAQLVGDDLAGANVSRDVARIAPSPDISPRWLLHALRSRFVRGQLAATVMGAAVQGLNIRSLKRVKLPVPSRQVQDSVANELDHADAQTRALIARLDASSSLLVERRRSLITAVIADATSAEVAA